MLGEIFKIFGFSDEQLFENARKKYTIESFSEFIQEFPNSVYVPEAYYWIAHIYYFADYSKGGIPDYEAALYYYEKSAELGCAKAISMLGLMYLLGNGPEQNFQKARMFFEKAAKQDEPWAFFRLAQIYRQGLGVEKDSSLVDYWIKKAYKNGDERLREQMFYLINVPIIIK